MNFYDRFELLELIRDDGVKTFGARELATGKVLEAHLFVLAHAPLSRALLSKLEKLPPAEKARILDRGKYEGTPYVVTEPITDFPTFSAWLSAKRKTEAPPPVPEAPTEPLGATNSPLNQAGAWQRPTFDPKTDPKADPKAEAKPAASVAPEGNLDQAFANLFDEPPPALRTQQNPIPKEAPREPQPTQAVGEFTRMFQAPKQPVAPPVIQEAAKPEPAKEPSGVQPAGEFTRMFQTPVPPPPSAPQPASQPTSQPTAGEFTSMFQAPASAPAPVPPAPPSPTAGEFTQMLAAAQPPAPVAKPAPEPAPPALPKAPEAGEFTSMFQVPAEDKTAPKTLIANPPVATPQLRETPKPAAPAVPPPAGEFTRMFNVSKSEALQPSRAPEPPAGPGEFTRMMQTPVPPPPQAPPAPPAHAQRPGEFTSLFQSPSGPMPQSPILQEPLRPQAPGGSGPNKVGEFTQVFGRGDIPAAPPNLPPAPANVPPSTATQAFQAPPPPPAYQPPAYPPPGNAAPSPFGPPSPFAPPQQAMPPVGTPPPAPTDNFTRQFSAPAQLTLGQAGPGAPLRAPVKPKSRLPLILAISGGVLVLILLIVFLLMRSK